MSLKLPLNIEEIKKLVPHRYPILLVDRVLTIGENFITGYKNVSVNEPFFQGHFPEVSIMPGVLIVEALAQISCIYEMLKDENQGKIGIFAGIDKVKFKKPVLPGDRLDLEAKLLWVKKGIGKCEGKAFVSGELACSAELTFALVKKEDIK